MCINCMKVVKLYIYTEVYLIVLKWNIATYTLNILHLKTDVI